jgi:hypothetical protein
MVMALAMEGGRAIPAVAESRRLRRSICVMVGSGSVQQDL